MVVTIWWEKREYLSQEGRVGLKKVSTKTFYDSRIFEKIGLVWFGRSSGTKVWGTLGVKCRWDQLFHQIPSGMFNHKALCNHIEFTDIHNIL